MSIPEILSRYLDEAQKKANTSDDYVSKLKSLDISDEIELWHVRANEQIDSFGLTQGQRAGITHILGDAGHIVRRDSKGDYIESYLVKVGDVRNLTDEQLLKITSRKGVRVLRALFGKSEE